MNALAREIRRQIERGGPMTFAGQVTGNVTSTDRVELQSGARVIGNVKAARITIADVLQSNGVIHVINKVLMP